MSYEPLVLVVEDEPPMRRLLRSTLQSHGYRVLEAATAAEGLALFGTNNPDLVVLDLGLPDLDGLEVTRRVRAGSATPIVVLSARGREADKVQALDAGADDYVTKPFGFPELLARMRVALRHAAARGHGHAEPHRADRRSRSTSTKRTVTLGGQEVRLTPIEYKMLATLARHLGKVLTHKQLLTEVWGPSYSDQSHYLRVHMAQLRRKIEADPARDLDCWTTEPGVGYRLREDPNDA
ncbi:MAG: response regulator [Polyangiaceae bacterium]|nr:response regulator [Polyangiaceae bacterium]